MLKRLSCSLFHEWELTGDVWACRECEPRYFGGEELPLDTIIKRIWCWLFHRETQCDMPTPIIDGKPFPVAECCRCGLFWRY